MQYFNYHQLGDGDFKLSSQKRLGKFRANGLRLLTEGQHSTDKLHGAMLLLRVQWEEALRNGDIPSDTLYRDYVKNSATSMGPLEQSHIEGVCSYLFREDSTMEGLIE